MKHVFVLFLFLNLVACAGSQQTKYYLLKTSDAPVAREEKLQGVLGVGPVTLPEYLDRKGIVTGQGEYELQVSDLHRWAENLDLNVARELAVSLRVQNLGVRILRSPSETREKLRTRLVVDISQFERVTGDRVMLAAEVKFHSGKEENVMRKDYQVSASCSGAGYPGTVACMSKALEVLAEQIAEHIRSSNFVNSIYKTQ